MANTSRIRGFRPVKKLTGSPYTGQVNIYEIAAGEGTATFVGDMMAAGTDAATDYYPAIQRLAASGQVTSGLLIGAVVGFLVPSATGTSLALDVPIYRAASTKRFVLVADDPFLIYEVQDGGTVPCAIASLGLNTGITAAAGSTVTGLSNMATGTTAPTTTNTLPLQVVGIVNRPDNEQAVASQKLLVRINSHQFVGAQTAV